MNVKKILITSLVSVLAIGGQNSRAQAAQSRSAETKAGSVEQYLMQMERDWGKAIVERNVARIREIVAADVVLTTPDGTVQSLADDLA